MKITRPEGTEEVQPAKKPKAAAAWKRPQRRDLIKQQDTRRSAEPVPIERVRPPAIGDLDARAVTKAADAAALAARGLRAVSAAAAVSRHGGR